MLYPPNTRHWQKGDLVIHWCDAKRSDMLMRVIGYTRGGLCKTQYENRRHGRKVWTNAVSNLLNPADFGIALSTEDLAAIKGSSE